MKMRVKMRIENGGWGWEMRGLRIRVKVAIGRLRELPTSADALGGVQGCLT